MYREDGRKSLKKLTTLIDFYKVLPIILALGGLLFGYALILLSTALIIISFTKPPISIWIRRREYAYA